ncbi:PBSX family phage terminase large subunit [Mucilaginibacter auburnensis]|uniref:Phage terminase large subunit n=1 Tax=Mucilaginibacter auburnensis TaxID=1457233 RepID=A0A2H9VNR9_9SPHI|nr:terminase large subunit [Mucilaginibacter auburnensis]PJJ79956.1 phage terminase large subunit [Mucilaginibacter auburnensis]
MAAQASILFRRNYAATAQVVVNQGGTSSGKTFAIEQVLFCKACETGNLVITVVGQDIPNLKAGALRDALKIYNDSEEIKSAVKSFNKTDRIFEFHNGSIIEFKSYDNDQDAKSGKRDYLFVNEANGIDWLIYSELALRTRIRIFIDYNPNTAFWVHDNLLGKPGVELIISDHRHNPFLDDASRQKIEGLKDDDEERWKVYARGLTGKISGLVLTNWHLCDAIPVDARLLAAGLDFGFTNDETGCLLVYQKSGELWINEVLYETGLTNQDVSKRLLLAGLTKSHEIVADSAEPKSIEELKRLGWFISAAKKGPDSVKHSIDILKRYKLNITRQSVNLRKELERYKWRTDASGKATNQPVDTWNHLIDPLRYVALNKLKVNATGGTRSRLPHLNTNNSNNNDLLNQMISA